MEVPKFKRAFGLKVFKISEEEYMASGDLVDTLVEKTDVADTGAFIARVSGASKFEKTTIDYVRDLCRQDVTTKVFRPEVLNRRTLWAKKGFVAIHASRAEVSNTQASNFQRSFLDTDLQERQNTELESALSGGNNVNDCINAFYKILRSKRRLLYGTNIDPREINPHAKVPTTDRASMAEMSCHIHALGDYKGVTYPTLYIGTEGTAFACHREDVAFATVNRHISGAAKIWFTVPPRYHNAFRELLSTMGLPDPVRQCNSLVQHKLYFIDPRVVFDAKIPVNTIIQRPGDIVYVLPNTIHWGFNLGLNLNEAKNLAPKTWAYPGMLSLQTCPCPDFGALCAKFPVVNVLKAIGISNEVLKDYGLKRLADIKQHLIHLNPSLCTSDGRPGDKRIHPENYLGPDITDMEQLGKFWERYMHDSSSESEDNDEDDKEVLNVLDSDDEVPQPDADLPGSVKGTWKCTRCSFDSMKYGRIKARPTIQRHVRLSHKGEEDKVMQEIDKVYGQRQYATKSFQCKLCKKILHSRESRHQQSCKIRNKK